MSKVPYHRNKPGLARAEGAGNAVMLIVSSTLILRRIVDVNFAATCGGYT